MTAPTEAAYGEWASPLTAAQVAAGAHRPIQAAYVGDAIWWSEPVPAENRVGVFREGEDGPEPVLRSPWSARSRVHEYGGGAWAATPDGALVFSSASDQRLYRAVPGGEPEALTTDDSRDRFAGLVALGDSVLAVRERHVGGGPTDVERHLVLVPLDGSAAADPDAVVPVVSGSRFLAHPAVSPDGSRLAWIAWDHPQMPWEGTELRVGDLVDGRVTGWQTLAGGPSESVLQPEWLDDERLAVISDRSGWWNLYRLGAAGGSLEPLRQVERETGGALWDLGFRWYRPVGDGRILAVETLGSERLVLLDGAAEPWVLRDGRGRMSVEAVRDGRALVIDDAADEPGALHELDLATGESRVVRSGLEGMPLEVFPRAEEREFDGVHAVVYPPSNLGFRAPAATLPPFVTMVHGGPTSHRGPMLSPAYAYYTSRGIGVVDVNYGGSTGYGRAYRERLDGGWGVVDLADVQTVARGLASAGLADPDRIAIEGGSAGGWTVLSALIAGVGFACGISSYGVADPVTLATDTHDFEAHYLDGLVGPYPEAADVYAARSPLLAVERLRRPVLLLQGLDDRVVPPAQSQRLAAALAEHGVPHAYLEFAGEGHGFRAPETVVAVREAALSFLGQVLGFTPPGVPVLQLQESGGKVETPERVVPEASAAGGTATGGTVPGATAEGAP